MKSKIPLNVNETRETITSDLFENHVYFLINRISPPLLPSPPPKKKIVGIIRWRLVRETLQLKSV